MARFDVYRPTRGKGYLLDCQADLLSALDTRLVVPLLPPAEAPFPAGRLNPVLAIGGAPHVMVTQYAAAVDRRLLRDLVGTQVDHADQIMGALDFLITGV